MRRADPLAARAARFRASGAALRGFPVAVILVALAGSTSRAQESTANRLHYPEAAELRGLVAAATAARQNGQLEQAVELYRQVLDADGPRPGRRGGDQYQIVLVSEEARADGPPQRRFQGATQAAIDGLRALPPEGIQLFRRKYDYRAASARDEALQAADPFRALARVYELYPVSSHAPGMLQVMGELALEEGALERALRCFERLMEHHGPELKDPSDVRGKLLLCAVGLGRAELVRELALALQRDDPEGELAVGPTPTTIEELLARTLRQEALRAGNHTGARPRLPLPRVDARNRALVDGPVGIGARRFEPRTFERAVIANGAGGRTVHLAQSRSQGEARNLPLLYEGTLFVPTADQLLAFDAETGESRPQIRRLGPAYSDGNPLVQFGGACDEGLVIAPQVEDILRGQQYRGIPITVNIPIRKLAGFEPARWRWVWDHARDLDGTPMEGWSFPSPPISQDGVTFAPAFSIEGFVNCYVTAFSSRTGAPLWTTWIASGQVEQTMFGEQATEPLCVPVALAEGVVFYSSSFGACAAVDADTGRILWVAEYDQIEVRAPRGYYADPRAIAWENNAPIVEGGVAVIAPMDSENYYGFDVRTGERLWRASRRAFAADADMRFLMGASGGRVVLAGGYEVRCLDARSGKLVWRAPLGGREVAGRGCIAGNLVCVPVNRDEVYVFELDTGKRAARYELSATGNLVVVGEYVLICRNGVLAVHRNGGAGQRGREF